MNEFQPPAPPAPVTVVVQQPKRSTLGRKVMGLFIGAVVVIAVISMIGANADTKTVKGTATVPASGSIDLGGEKPIDTATATWVSGDALDDVQQIVTYAEQGASAANAGDISGMNTACSALGRAGADLAEGAPQNAVGDAARAVADDFGRAATACADGDYSTAGAAMEDGSTDMTTLTNELKQYVGK